MKNASANPTLERKKIDTPKVKEALGKVDVVVQEYMDNLLGDLFLSPEDLELEALPDVISDSVAVNESDVTPVEVIPTVATILKPESKPLEKVVEEQVKVSADITSARKLPNTSSFTDDSPNTPEIKTYAKVIPHVSLPDENILPSVEEVDVIKEIEPIKPMPPVEAPRPLQVETLKSDMTLPAVDIPLPVEEGIETVKPLAKVDAIKDVEKRFPKAPDWAQESFDVLLFDVCGLKLAVPMESLGRIIKVEHETNQLIGRPDWFMGAYNEAEEHLYVVDTAKYIMPEKGYDLELDGFAYLIQMQKSKWTLACKNVHTTVRLEPDQVKWRSSQGKRQWLSGTVIEHMCALIHVDKLVELLEADS